MAETPGFGAGLGQFVGAAMGAKDLEAGVDKVNGIASGFGNTVAPYDEFGKGLIPLAGSAVHNLNETANQDTSYDTFMRNYQASPGAEYIKGQALEAQNESAASKGQLLSGTNLRELTKISEGVSGTYANQAYDEYTKGKSMQFGQLESALGGMFKAIGVGQTATGQEAGVATGQMGANSSLAQAQAKNDASKGSGLGSMFGGLGSLAAMF